MLRHLRRVQLRVQRLWTDCFVHDRTSLPQSFDLLRDQVRRHGNVCVPVESPAVCIPRLHTARTLRVVSGHALVQQLRLAVWANRNVGTVRGALMVLRLLRVVVRVVAEVLESDRLQRLLRIKRIQLMAR